MSATADRRRLRRRRLVAAVVLIDMFGIAALAFALSQRSDHTPTAAQTSASPVHRAHPQAPQTLIAETTRTASAARHEPARPTHRPARRDAVRRQSASSAAQASFRRLASGLPGASGLAVGSLSGGSVVTFGNLQIGHAWSTMKVPVLATLLRELEQSGGTLSSSQRAHAAAALEASDNSAAIALFSALEQSHGGLLGASDALQTTLRQTGDDAIVINTAPNSSGFTTWGQSQWSATGEVAFYRALANGCLLSTADTRYVLSLMSRVQSGQRWGAGSAGYPSSASLAFKGGWGPENGSGYLVRQTAIVGLGSGGYVMSMLAKPTDGSFGTGTQMLTQIATWAARTLVPHGGGSAPCP